jgi:PAS domain S-box
MNNLSSDKVEKKGTLFLNQDALELFINNLEGSYLLIDRDLRIIGTNKFTQDEVHDILGKEYKAGMSVLDLAPASRHSFLQNLYNEVFNGISKQSVVEIPLNNETVYYEVNYKPAYNGNQEIIGALVTTRNVTKRKKAEDTLKEIEERWQFALEGANQGAWDWNMETNEVIYSESYKKMYGFEENDLPDHIDEWVKRIHPDDRKQMEESIENHIKGNDPYLESVYRIKGKDEKYKWVLAKGMLISRNAKGKPLRMIGTHTDITDKKTAEEYYKLLFNHNPLPMWTYNINTLRFIDVNEAAIQHYGYSREEFLSMNIKQIRPEEEVDRLINTIHFRKCLHTLKGVWQHRKKNGEIFYVEISTYKFDDEFDPRVLVLANDITDKIKAQEELLISNKRFSYAVRAASEALWEWNVVTGEVYISDVYTEILGWKVNADWTFNEWHDYIHEEDREETIKDFYQTIENPAKDLWTRQYRYLKADGNYAHVIDKAIILRNEHGKAINVIGAIQDITQQKKLEQELLSNELERQKAINQATIETQEQERSEIGKELHDNVNQVLTTTKLYMDLALSNSELKDELIKKSSKNIISVINEIRQLSRSLMDPSIGDLGLVDSIRDLMESIHLTRKLQVTLNCELQIDCMLNKIQKLTIFRIIQEALNNAMTHSKATQVTLNFEKDNDQLMIEIEDNGVGFDPLQVKKGAGLKNIQNRIYLINGKHTLRSSPGTGCKLIINFPIN